MGHGASVLATIVSENLRDQHLIENYLLQSPLAIALEKADIYQFANCFDLVILNANNDLDEKVHFKSKTKSPHFFVVAEGQVDISVMVPCPNRKTDFVREILCSKKAGDVLFVPAVEKLATNIHKASMDEENPNHRMCMVHQHPNSDVLNENDQEYIALRSPTNPMSKLFGLSTNQSTNSSTEPTIKVLCDHLKSLTHFQSPTKAQKLSSHQRQESKLIKHLDLTTIMVAPYNGAKVLQLNQEKFDAYLSEIENIKMEEDSSDDEEAKSMGNAEFFQKHKLPNLELLKVMLTSNIQDYLKKIHFISKIPLTKIHMLGEMSRFEMATRNTIICREGNQGDRVFIVLHGKLSIYAKKIRDNLNQGDISLDDVTIKDIGDKPTTNNDEKFKEGSDYGRHLGFLFPGDYFGEMAILGDIPRQATIISTEPTLLISISRQHFRNLMKILPEVAESVKREMKLHFITSFLNTLNTEQEHSNDVHPFVSNPETLDLLVDKGSIVIVNGGEQVITEGQDADSFYFVFHGTLVAARASNDEGSNNDVLIDKEVHLGVLGPGRYFGEISMLTDTKCWATIRTLSRCLLLKVSEHDFHEVWCKVIPEFRAELLVRIYGKKCRIQHIFNHHMGKRSFSEFVKQESAYENIKFLNKVAFYKGQHGSSTKEENIQIVSEVFQQFLEQNSQDQVNLPQSYVALCEKELKNSIENNEHPGLNLFDASEREIFNLLEQGPFPRFLQSKSCHVLLSRMRAYDNIDLRKLRSFAEEDIQQWGSLIEETPGFYEEEIKKPYTATTQVINFFAPPPTVDQRVTLLMGSKSPS